MTDTDALCCLHNVIYCMFACLHGPREMLLEMSGPRVPPMFFLHALKPIALLDQIQSVCFCAMVLVLSVQMNVFFPLWSSSKKCLLFSCRLFKHISVVQGQTYKSWLCILNTETRGSRGSHILLFMSDAHNCFPHWTISCCVECVLIFWGKKKQNGL